MGQLLLAVKAQECLPLLVGEWAILIPSEKSQRVLLIPGLGLGRSEGGLRWDRKAASLDMIVGVSLGSDIIDAG
ncbi:uncharacterized protein H6S33_007684 [Morchella sextelata]|uniref:uncharacterized protein n=1 Tax=Morchella sextelata TaxID=1174677 RepID=UPI001D0495B0|nr:uncharacterized protein H6S33_007684 [Morchella sextelata]KAH0603362.1 hypothetical protein H6S33_007684 [Morchella sextelata]